MGYLLFFATGAFSQNKCPTTYEKYVFLENHENVIYSLPQAPFRKKNVQKIMKNMRISKKVMEKLGNYRCVVKIASKRARQY